MFISSRASSSRLRPTICTICRSFTSTSAVSVKRPQKPYEAPVAKIDAYGNRIPIDFHSLGDKAEIKRKEFLESLSERRSRSYIEKYGNSEKFGLRRSSNRNYQRDEDLGDRARNSNSDGGLYDELEAEDWRAKIGIKSSYYTTKSLKPGRRKFDRAMESYMEEAKRLNPNADQIKLENEYKKDQKKGRKQKIPGLPPPGMQNNRRDSRLTAPHRIGSDRKKFNNENDRDDKRSKLFLKSPKKTFGLNLITFSNSRGGGYQGGNDHNPSSSLSEPKQPKSSSEYWRPTKKLTYSAMAGLRTLYSMNPEKFNRQFLSEKFGISREAVTRILKSKYRSNSTDDEGSGLGSGSGLVIPGGNDTLKGTKWDRNPGSSEEISPVPAILRAFGRDK
ncbi:hypothetical protein L486_02705 [Kwoniella mangroviensis CBS 10435]|uniref:Required for respiratory growth protein 9, mitochondrial n=1 Tax=Kwoniella mangroviensis CBS 10435 TaxID=1331196 RepID=A0A1B9IWZ0_9TREE|nr:hypothetical protein L486_02705 [Kwoniella mangroviensis CBS 10435]